MNTEKIWENLAESIRIEKDGTTIPVPVEDIRALLEERNSLAADRFASDRTVFNLGDYR